MKPERIIAESAHTLARTLPGSVVESLADAVLTHTEVTVRAEIIRRVPHYHQRDIIFAFLDRWKNEAAGIDARTVSVALETAAKAERSHRDSQSVEMVWTGPSTEYSPFRRTEQAIIQVLDVAKNRITLVSFAVYRIPNICRALVSAAQRGVRLTVILETPDKIEGEGEYSTIKALGQEVAACSSVYFWPIERRLRGDNNKVGILHVKCAVADGEWLFLSSANLTQQAFTVNMELGTLIHGGSMPGQVEQQFDRLIQSGQLVRV